MKIYKKAMICGATLVLLGINGLEAQAGDPDINCANAINTIEMKYCADLDHKREDKRLNEVYKRLMGGLDKQGQKILREAQRAWIPYRDKNCSLHADSMRGGTGSGLLFLSCMAEMTSSRADELEMMEGMH